jgi:hypothetical protein
VTNCAQSQAGRAYDLFERAMMVGALILSTFAEVAFQSRYEINAKVKLRLWCSGVAVIFRRLGELDVNCHKMY